MAYETDIFTGCTGLLACMSTWANTVTYGLFWTIVTISFGFVLFLATSRLGTSRSFGFATFGTGVVAMLLALGGWMPWYIASFFIILLGVGIVVMRMSER